MLYIIIIILSVNCVVYTLRCYGDATCRFKINFNELLPAKHLWPENCRLNINETDVKQCSCYFEVDYEKQTTGITLLAETYMLNLFSYLGTTSPITKVLL
ncbi:unnamed protein product, partial [Adineta steineri]